MDRQKLGGELKPSKASDRTKLPKKKLGETLDDSSSLNGTDGVGFLCVPNRVLISADFRSKEEFSELKAKLQTELLSVRDLMKKIERYSGKTKKLLSVGSLDDSDGKKRGVAGKGMKTPVMENSCVRLSSKVFRSCSLLLNKLMKSKGCWLFNEPVDVEGLGLDDYLTVIKHPMDLGTVKSRLTTNRYKTPQEFAEDVRLTFQNAVTYNTEGHEISALAKQLLKMFEDKWEVIETDYLRQLNKTADSTARTSPPLTVPPLIVNRSEAVLNAADPESKNIGLVASGKTRLPKPKAKDPHKRDMTLEEKGKLSASLQDLPPEKLEGVVRIIKKRNPSLSQNDDEIEVDIDTVDTETLWELDRFVTYYKKDLSKMRRSAKLAQEKNRADCGIVEAKDDADDKNIFSSASNEGEQEGGNASLSGAASSDSGSSSSESDTDSSSS